VVAYILPNCNETADHPARRRIGGHRQPDQPAARARTDRRILRETNAKVVVTLEAFPKTDVAQKVAEAVAHAPNVRPCSRSTCCAT
jgi:fatty-acyl-CoA synthase